MAVTAQQNSKIEREALKLIAKYHIKRRDWGDPRELKYVSMSRTIDM
jgi:hypothetical protein